MAYGEYTLEGDMNLTPFFEVLYVERDFFSDSGAGQVVSRRARAEPVQSLQPRGRKRRRLRARVERDVEQSQLRRAIRRSLWRSPKRPRLPVQPSPGTHSNATDRIRAGDRSQIFADLSMLRMVGRGRGGPAVAGFGGFSNWTFDFSVVQSMADGAVRRPGIREDRLFFALGTYSTTNTPCENDTGEALDADVAPGCVPVNMFAPSLYPESVVGDFATAAERNYVFDDRDFDTVYQQTLVSYYMTGNVFQLPADWIVGGFGIEYRLDDLDSIPDNVARDGLFIGYFADGGAIGDKYTREIFGELEIPIIAGQPAAEELVLNVSARWTDDEFYGGAWTHSYKMAYRPISSLLFRVTTGRPIARRTCGNCSSYRRPGSRPCSTRASSRETPSMN